MGILTPVSRAGLRLHLGGDVLGVHGPRYAGSLTAAMLARGYYVRCTVKDGGAVA